MNLIKKIVFKIRGEVSTDELKKRGMKVGKNFHRMAQVVIDPGHCWLVKIGDNVTLAPRVYILCHDASTKMFLNYAKIGIVTIGNNVFIGAGSFILPNVTIGDNVVIGANSTVCSNIPSNTVAVGSPAKVICSIDDYLSKIKVQMQKQPVFGEEYTLRCKIDEPLKKEMIEKLSTGIGFIE